MSSFYCRYSKWKTGRWQTEVVGKHNVSRNSVTIKSLWLQSLLFCIFCHGCTCAPTSDSLSPIESLHAKPNFVDLRMAYAPETQHSVALIAISQPEVSQQNNSVANSNTRSLSSFPGELLRTGLLNDTSLDHMLKTPSSATVVHSKMFETLTPPQNWSPLSETTVPHKWSSLSETPTPSHKWSPPSEMPTTPQKRDSVLLQTLALVDAKPSPAVEGQMLSTLKHVSFSSPEYMPSTGSSNKQEQTAFPDLRSFLVQSESTSLSTAYSDGKHVAKLISYSNVPGNLFPVTGGTKVLNLMTSSGYTNNRLKELTTSDQKNEQYIGSSKTGTDQFNLKDTYVHNLFETSTTGLQNSDVPVTKTSPTDLSLDSSTVSVNTKAYSQNSKSSSTPLVFSGYTSLYLRKENPLDLASVTVDRSTDLSHMTMQTIGSSSVADGTSVGTLFTLSNLAAHVQQNPSAQTISQTSKTDQTSEQDRGLKQERSTLRTISVSTWPSQTMSTAEVSHSMSFKTPHQTDFNTLSSVTPSTFYVKNKACLLQIHETANTQTPETSSETLKLTTLYKPTDYESYTTVLLTSNYEPSNDASTPVESTHTDVQLGFQSTMTPSFESDPFHDAMNGSGKTNQSTFNLTSTRSSSTVPSTGVSKSLSTFTPLRKSSTSQQSSSTVSSVQKLQTSQSTHYSTETYRVSLSEANVGQGRTFHQLSTASTPAGTRSSHVPRTISAALQRTISTKSVADLETSSMKTSTYHTSMKDHLFSKLYSTRHPMTTQQTSSSLGRSRAVMATTVKNLNILTSPLSSVASSKATMKPLLTSTPSSSLASLSQSSKITLHNATSTIQVTPGAKEWIPKTIFPPKPTYNSRQTVSSTIAALVVTMPLNFHLTGVSFNEQLTNRTSDEYKTLEKEIKLVMDKIYFDKYQNSYLTTEIKSFLKGSVIVESNIVFKNNPYMPSASDIIRTLLTDGTKTDYFEWSINGSTVELNGYKRSNMPLENLPISLLVLRAGYIAVSQKNQKNQSILDNLQNAVFNAVHTLFPIANVSFSQIRNVYGDLTVRGNLYLNSTVHTNVQSLMSTLLPLVNRSVDLSSIIVNGIGNELKVHSINFRLTNEQFVLNLLDMSSTESQLLSKDLSTVVESVLRDGSLLQVIMREFKSGSVVCRGDLVYQLPGPGSREVLKIFLGSLGSDGILGSSKYKVDSKSIIIGDSSPGPYNEYLDFPGFGVAIIVMCGLCILIFPIILFVCVRTRMLGHRKKATIQRQHNPDNQSHFEMDNRAFRTFEQP